MPDLSETIALADLPVDRRKLNGSLRGARNATMLALIGNPRGSYDHECRLPTNGRMLALMRTADFGPFRATGLAPAVETLTHILADIRAEAPEIHDALGSAGMLCCRLVRGSRSAISNHSWVTAIDLTVGGRLDRRGDGRALRALAAIHPIFNRHGFYWGAAFRTEDAMHFEASDQLVRRWAADGRLGPQPRRVRTGFLQMGGRGPEVVKLQHRLNETLALDLVADGIFGPATRAAVVEYQRRHGLGPDGIVGRMTMRALARAETAAAA
jgi:hypothetical protein